MVHMDNYRTLIGLKADEIAKALELKKSFQGRQIQGWISKGVLSFDKMTDLSLETRESLKDARIASSTVCYREADPASGAVKLGIKLYDGFIIEAVLLSDSEGSLTACLSSQVGCAMGCKFCRTGTMGFKRNLEAYEIIEQFLFLRGEGQAIEHIVFMGMGECLLNLPSALEAIAYFHDQLGMSHRRITVSTCGYVPGIKALAAAEVPVKLAVSLVDADQSKRASLMPISRRFSLSELKDALLAYQRVYGRRITLEYCMLSGINTAADDAAKLQSFSMGLDAVINLIPFNEAAELDFKTPSSKEIKAFTHELDRRGLHYTTRVSRGRDIKGACGQLASKLEEQDDER
jgi:23S rRNA (adenine2503-C2)-methyltransferase